MAIQTSTGGIFQGDVIIRTAVMQGIRELRKKPELLDYCFASLPQDDLTSKDYGQGTIERAREWFVNTEIVVKMDLSINQPKFPCITITLQQSSESEATLGDVHYEPTELDDSSWPAASPVFAATSYDPDTGYVGLPASIADSLLVFPGMVLVDRTNQPFPIVASVDESTVEIAPAVADFTQCTLKYQRPATAVSLESLSFRGTFDVGCHVQGESEQLIWLHSIVLFILLRYKQNYFEARGFERSTLTCTGLTRDPTWQVENIYTQYIQMTGYWRNYWPKAIGPRIAGVLANPMMIADGPATTQQIDLNEDAWDMEADVSLGDLRFVGVKGSAE